MHLCEVEAESALQSGRPRNANAVVDRRQVGLVEATVVSGDDSNLVKRLISRHAIPILPSHERSGLQCLQCDIRTLHNP
jgi:hypothetical protein